MPKLIKPDQYDIKLDENDNCITMNVHKNTVGGYDIYFNDRNTKSSQERVQKHSTENNYGTAKLYIGQEE